MNFTVSPENVMLSDFISQSSILNLLPSAVYACEADGTIVFYNQKAVELWGRVPAKGDKDERFCGAFRLYYKDGQYLPHNETPMAECLADGVPRNDLDVVIERPDHSRIFVRVNIVPIKSSDGEVQGAINSFYEITEQRRIEEALRASEIKYKNLVATLQTPLYTTDAKGRITLYNEAAVRLWGQEPVLDRDRWCGGFKILTKDKEIPPDDSPMATCVKDGMPILGKEITIVRPDGTRRDVATYAQPLRDDEGKVTGTVNMLIDVTAANETKEALRKSEAQYRELADSLEKKVEEKTADLKAKHEELKKSEERYHKMIEEVEDYAIILLDANGIIQNWNKGAEKIKGYAENQIVGKSFSNFYLPEDRESGLPQRLLKAAAEKGKAIHEGWRRRSDGSRFWGSIVLTALHNDKNEIIGFSKVTRDLTERKLAEDKLREYTSQLEFQNKELEQFAYAASHDMKEPLRKIHLYNSYIADNASNTLDERSREYLKRSLNAVTRMTALIEDLLTYSKTTSALENFESVNLQEIIDEIILLHREEFEQKKVSFSVKDLPEIHAIPFQIKQLFFNLINNSVKYRHPDRDVHIEISSRLIRGVDLQETENKKSQVYLNISVSDNGIGFKSQYADRIFDIFQRLNNSPATAGSGIGLAICRRVVQNHHGFIKASGKENEGARFDIYLPHSLSA